MMVNKKREEVKKLGKMKVLPENWNVKQIKNLMDLESGVWDKENENGYPVLRSTNFTEKGFVDFDEVTYRDIPERKIKAKKLVEGDILLEISGGGPDQPVGRVVYFKNNKEENYLFGNFVKRLRLNEESETNNLPFYIFRFLQRYYNIGQTEVLQHQTTGIRNLDYRAYMSLPIPLPPKKEQKKIAAILSSIDETIEKTDQVIEKTKELKKGLMQELLTKGIGHDEFKEVRVGVKDYKVPINWEVEILGNLIKGKPRYGANSSAIDYKRNLPRYIRITDISDDGHLKDDDMKSIPEEEAESYYLEENDIVFARTGATVGKTYIYKETDGRCAYAGYLIRFKIDKSKVLPDYLLYVTHSYYYDSWVKSMIRATSQPNINSKEYASFELLLPPLEEQKKIAKILSTVEEKVQKEEEYKTKLERLKKGLMQKLLTGEIRVNVDDIKEA